ncbi:hypothetical protein OHC33_011165 [Knufia fluminis]|uniref:Catalase core domain-containing protein n=1 Tax=Knufia fluminis TaxID=191047 RepID=A0AAN8I311_9EURO|nr:hypothetical protein OHC33_011165 [Knufia fluminis]
MPSTEEKKQKILATIDPEHHSLIEKAFGNPGDMTEEESQKLKELVAKGHNDLAKHNARPQIKSIPLASDVFLFQKQQAFNRHKLLERMVHPCGSGAFGYFEATKDMSSYTKASFLQSSGLKTPIFIRFSTVTLGREFPDTARNPRGFAVKFYTGEGNYDIVGLDFPVFFCRDPIQGPDVIRSQGRRPDNFLLDYNATFDLLANNVWQESSARRKTQGLGLIVSHTGETTMTVYLSGIQTGR